MLFGDGPKGNKFANAGVGKNNIDSLLHLGNDLVKTIKVGEFGNVALNARNIAADCLHGLVEFLLPAAGDEDVGTLFDEEFCRSQPNPFCAAGDDGDFTFELFEHCFHLFLPISNEPLHSVSFVLWEGHPEHGSAALRLLFCGLILNDVPMRDKDFVLNAHNICGNPIHR